MQPDFFGNGGWSLADGLGHGPEGVSLVNAGQDSAPVFQSEMFERSMLGFHNYHHL